MTEPNFIDEMLQEILQKELRMELAHVDAVLMEIGSITSQIEKNFQQAEQEKQIISDWALKRNSTLQERVDWLSLKLEAYMNEQEPSIRTIDLAHGLLQRRKSVEKIAIDDLQKFMENPNLSQLTTTAPEVIKPDLTKIKTFFKMTGKIPIGTTLIESKDKFSIKLKQNGEIKDGTTKVGVRGEQADAD